MRKTFFDCLYKEMEKNEDIYLIFVDLGWPRTDEFFKKYPKRAFSTGASEQTALDIAVGLVYAGKIPIIYTISPFYLRAFETIRTHINHNNLHVIMVGAGVNDDYSKDHGYSHYAGDIPEIMATQKNIIQHYPEDIEQLKDDVDLAINISKPHFLNVKR